MSRVIFEQNTYILLTKGASEIILKYSKYLYDWKEDSVVNINPEVKDKI